ncbi:MAG: M48 family metallopeptidase, partial [Desulfobulbaceae bacterium]|nr:M48 family metallopeptidase [Desulfobulbaceae bacterium]
VYWGHTRIDFSYRFVQRKTLAISVHPDLSVTVKVPEGTEVEEIRKKIKKRGAWIRKTWREFELYLPKQPPRQYVSGETHRYLGRQYRLKILQGKEDSVKCLRGYLWVTSSCEPTSARAEKLLGDWYRRQAHRVFRKRLEVCFQRVARKGVETPTLRIQKMAGRWGSCSDQGRIILNLELIKAPKECIDYVIIHELCHLKEKYHGPRFWRMLEKLMPDYRERRKRLNRYADV